MNYAKINDGIVKNVISVRRAQAHEFPDCVEIGDIPVGIGDVYKDGKFYRNGKQVKSFSYETFSKLQNVSATALSSVKDTCKQLNKAPESNVGIYICGAEEWQSGKTYERYDLFSYNGVVGWVKQLHTSQETWLPFTTGTESLYGARPEPDEDGIYPYLYNMKVDVGMKVREEDIVYECIQATDDLLYAPSQVPALFKIVELT